MRAEPPNDAEVVGFRSRLTGVRARVRSLPGGALLWRVAITIAGALVIVIGVILLPLPGPGWLIIFAGLALLATEYTWAARLLIRARHLVLRWTQWAARQHIAARVALVVAVIVAVVAVLAGGWWLSSRM